MMVIMNFSKAFVRKRHDFYKNCSHGQENRPNDLISFSKTFIMIGLTLRTIWKNCLERKFLLQPLKVKIFFVATNRDKKCLHENGHHIKESQDFDLISFAKTSK